MIVGTLGGQGFDPRVIKPIPVPTGIKPHRNELERGQEPWPSLMGLAGDWLSWPGERRQNLAPCQTWAGTPTLLPRS